ncbi:adsorption protein B [Sphingomonas sp. BE138]|uniref:glycosyl transferase family protein n=1 Tax=Sphingomonas sp. BE138 TaxID=2817845 RepID=UPI0028602974|nr:glycosyl transferase family protein [Sphingomonas sp. BE138]MDR6789051.1 adsorption protein B [Sphingomonas sp. BE138]
MTGALGAFDRGLAELALFAATVILIGGIDDLLMDLVWWRVRRDEPVRGDVPPAPALSLAVFVPAWDEQRVIGAMLSATLARYDHPDYRIYVGCYPNDPGTLAAAQAVAAGDARVRVVTVAHDGPTTKADCLNHLWRALRDDDAAVGHRSAAIVLHDAEDVVHPAELRVFDDHLRDAALVQLPVVPLIDPRRHWVSGHYADEFAEAHRRDLVVRSALGAALPLAGVGCAIRRDALERLDDGRGTPFEPQSLTEDYELGLRVAALGLPARFVRWRERKGGALIATRAFFPDTIDTAVRQKARWVTGIALSGWDRTGWGTRRDVAEYWMRMRDRRGLLAVLALLAAYAALVGWSVSALAHAWGGSVLAPAGTGLRALLMLNAGLLCWRLAARAMHTAAEHGWREARRSVPRALVANGIAMLAARRAVTRYVATLLGAAPRWDKTAHRFPEILPAAR